MLGIVPGLVIRWRETVPTLTRETDIYALLRECRVNSHGGRVPNGGSSELGKILWMEPFRLKGGTWTVLREVTHIL